MTRLRQQLPYSACPKTVLQPVDQVGKFRWFGSVYPNSKPSLLIGHVLRTQDMQCRGFEAKVRFELAVKAIKPQADQLGHMQGIPIRSGQSQIERDCCTISLEQKQPNEARANCITGKILHERLKQMPRRLQHLLLV